MMEKEVYLKNPCGALSIPLWKWQQMVIPENMRILHDRNYSPLDGFRDEPFFRIRHDLTIVPEVRSDKYTVRTVSAEELPVVVQIINESYEYLSVTEGEIRAYTQRAVYDAQLWLAAVDSTTEEMVGCIIAELDREIREGILEWLQVLPWHRRKGIGRLLVLTLLGRMSGKADFVTVSGRCNDVSNPENLYRKCGFSGNDVWHILRKG